MDPGRCWVVPGGGGGTFTAFFDELYRSWPSICLCCVCVAVITAATVGRASGHVTGGVTGFTLRVVVFVAHVRAATFSVAGVDGVIFLGFFRAATFLLSGQVVSFSFWALVNGCHCLCGPSGVTFLERVRRKLGIVRSCVSRHISPYFPTVM